MQRRSQHTGRTARGGRTRRIRTRGPRRRWAALLLAAPLVAHAVAIDTGDGTGNTSPPGDDFGYDSVGVASGRSGVYLGDGWVLTADHVNDQPINFLGTTYQPIPGTGVQLTNTSGDPPDLFVYRVYGFPPVAPVVLASEAPSVGEEVHCVGNGLNRAVSSTQWNVTWGTTPPFEYEGYENSPGRSKRWGRNEVTTVGIDVEISPRSTRSFETTFDESGVADESQSWTGDSGGGCFAKRFGTWELVGVMFAQGTIGPPLPPQPPNTAVYSNTTAAADVFFYRDQIEELAPPLGEVPSLSRWGAGGLALLLLGFARIGWIRAVRARRAAGERGAR